MNTKKSVRAERAKVKQRHAAENAARVAALTARVGQKAAESTGVPA